MHPQDWLKHRIAAYAVLRPEEIQAIQDFTFLWSLFESRLLAANASSAAIRQAVRDAANAGSITLSSYTLPFNYFSARYFERGSFTHHFGHLNLRGNDFPTEVKAALSRANTDPVEIVAALLIIVYRLRNNLFHGSKWDYDLRGQLENFQHANDILITFMDPHPLF